MKLFINRNSSNKQVSLIVRKKELSPELKKILEKPNKRFLKESELKWLLKK